MMQSLHIYRALLAQRSAQRILPRAGTLSSGLPVSWTVGRFHVVPLAVVPQLGAVSSRTAVRCMSSQAGSAKAAGKAGAQQQQQQQQEQQAEEAAYDADEPFAAKASRGMCLRAGAVCLLY